MSRIYLESKNSKYQKSTIITSAIEVNTPPSKPILLDLFCSAGGAGEGYRQAGFHVVAVDIEPQPHNHHEFYQDDALRVLDVLLAGDTWNGYQLSDFSAIHSSPVCKAYTNCNLSPHEKHPMQIADVRIRLQDAGKPYVIENVVGAKSHMRASLMLCGSMFGLPVQRHRLFEIGNTDLFIFPPSQCDHRKATINVYGHSVWDSSIEGTKRKDGKRRPDSVPVEVGRQALGIDWMNINELAQAIPPAYTRFIGQQLMSIIDTSMEVAL